MYCSDYEERPQLDNLLSFMLHYLIFLGIIRSSLRISYSFALYSYSAKILQPYVATTVQMHSDAVFASINASRMKTVINS